MGLFEAADEPGESSFCILHAIIVPGSPRLTRIEGANNLANGPLAAKRFLRIAIARQDLHKGDNVVINTKLTAGELDKSVPSASGVLVLQRTGFLFSRVIVTAQLLNGPIVDCD